MGITSFGVYGGDAPAAAKSPLQEHPSPAAKQNAELLLLFTGQECAFTVHSEHDSGAKGNFCAAKLGILPRILL